MGDMCSAYDKDDELLVPEDHFRQERGPIVPLKTRGFVDFSGKWQFKSETNYNQHLQDLGYSLNESNNLASKLGDFYETLDCTPSDLFIRRNYIDLQGQRRERSFDIKLDGTRAMVVKNIRNDKMIITGKWDENGRKIMINERSKNGDQNFISERYIDNEGRYIINTKSQGNGVSFSMVLVPVSQFNEFSGKWSIVEHNNLAEHLIFVGNTPNQAQNLLARIAHLSVTYQCTQDNLRMLKSFQNERGKTSEIKADLRLNGESVSQIENLNGNLFNTISYWAVNGSQIVTESRSLNGSMGFIITRYIDRDNRLVEQCKTIDSKGPSHTITYVKE